MLSVNVVFMSLIQIWSKMSKITNQISSAPSPAAAVKSNNKKMLQQLLLAGYPRFNGVMSRCKLFFQKIWQVWVQAQCGVNRLKLSHIVNVTYGLNWVLPRCLCLPKLFAHPHWQMSVATVFAHISTKTKVSPSLVHEERHLELNHLSVFDKFNVFLLLSLTG